VIDTNGLAVRLTLTTGDAHDITLSNWRCNATE
jgi:hypothetical protein